MNLYTDGGVIQKNPSPIGGTWAWVLTGDDDQIIDQDSGVVSADENGGPVTNTQMELYAIIQGLLKVRNPSALKHVYSDSNVSLGRVFKGWSLNNIPSGMIRLLGLAKERYPWIQVKVQHTLLDGHPTKAQLEAGIGKRGHPVSKWNVLCDKMCNEAGAEYVKRLRDNNPS